MSGSKGQEIVYTWARLNTPTHKELSDTIDAALRRAKAEGMRLSKHEYQCWEDAMWSAETKDVVTFGQWIDARAAQIEEGE